MVSTCAETVTFALTDRGYLPLGDDASLMRHAFIRTEALQQGLYAAMTVCPNSGAPYPPLVTLFAGSVASMTGGGIPAIVASQAVWMLVGGVSAIFCGELLLGRWGALAGPACWFLMTRMLVGTFYTEPAVAALLLATLTALACSDGLRRVDRAAIAGVTAGLGLLAKFTFAMFAGPPAAMFLIGSLTAGVWRGPRRGLARVATSVGVGLGVSLSIGLTVAWATWGTGGALLGGVVVVTALLCGFGLGGASRTVGVGALLFVGLSGGLVWPWFHSCAFELRSFLEGNAARNFEGDAIPFPLAMRFYVTILGQHALGSITLILALVGAARTILRPSLLPGLGLLAVASGVVLLGAAPYQNARYILPALAALVPVALSAIPRRMAPPAAVLASACVAALLATRDPTVHARVLARSGLGEGETRVGGLAEPRGTSRDGVEEAVRTPWLVPRMDVALPLPEPALPPIRLAFLEIERRCASDHPVDLTFQPPEVRGALGALSEWESNGRILYVEMPVPVGNVARVEVQPAASPPYRLTFPTSDGACR